jgi:hypothetical protein
LDCLVSDAVESHSLLGVVERWDLLGGSEVLALCD